MTLQAREIRVWDPLIRLFHWALVAGFFIAYFAGDGWENLHVTAGYVVAGLISFRLIWGLFGSRHARFRDFVYGPRRVLGYLRKIVLLRAPRYIGHNPAGGAMIVLLLLMLLATTLSGMSLYGADAWAGPLAGLLKGTSDATIHQLKEFHEFCANFTVFLVAVHVGGVVLESLLHRENLVRAMVTGRKRA